MQTSARPAWLALACVVACISACLPPDPPEWVVTYPITWGIQASVVGAGMYSKDLEVLPGHTRAEMLPLDTVELRWFGAAPEDAQIRPPIWLLASGGLPLFVPAGGVQPCEQPLTSIYGFCRLGEGERIRVTLAALPQGLDSFNQRHFRVLTVASDGEVIAPETCLQRTLSERNPDLSGCLIAVRSVPIGPVWRLSQLFVGDDDLPEAYFGVPANTNPMITALRVERSSARGTSMQLAAPGDRISVRPGEQITVTLELDAAQEYVVTYKDRDDAYVTKPYTEELIIEARLNALIDDYVASDDGLTHGWTAPDAPEAVTFFAQVGDYRHNSDGGGGFGFATLRLVSTLEDGEAP